MDNTKVTKIIEKWGCYPGMTKKIAYMVHIKAKQRTSDLNGVKWTKEDDHHNKKSYLRREFSLLKS